MFSPPVLIAVCCLYMAFLFVIALRVERKAAAGTDVGNNAVIYALSLSVFPTAWSFYGSVGKAASTGMWFISFHLGSTLAAILWWIILRKMVRIKNCYRITSIADFISLRYNKSALIAALVTVIAVLGMVPYIALQLKAVTATFRIITGFPAPRGNLWANMDIGLIITGIIILFTIILGVRKLVPTERHQGIVVAMAVEGVVKLTALLAVGAYVTYGLFGGIGDIFERFAESPYSQSIASVQTTPSFYVTWTTSLLLAMSAVMFLPRQFHMEVVENFEEKHIRTAMWLFPLYMFLMNIFILPIALGGILSGYPADLADSFVLRLPLSSGKPLLSLLVFLGGFSAATGMITVSSMTVSTMVTNHVVLPLIESVKPLDFIKRHLLQCRWITVAALILAGYWFERNVGPYFPLVDIGTISFTAVLQFAPAIIGGLFWKRGNAVGALLGMGGGFLLWIYTLILPAFAKGGFISRNFLESGPLNIGILRPEHLFGVTGLDPTSHAVLWTLLFNAGFYALGSLFVEQGEEERNLSAEFVDALAAAAGPVRLTFEATIDLAVKKQHMEELFNQYFPAANAVELAEQCLAVLHIDGRGTISIVELAELHREAENRLAGSIGAAAAHKAIHRTAIMTPAEEGALKQVYGDILAELKLSPSDLKMKIDYYREKERLLTAHSGELEEKIAERDSEIMERRKAEEALRNSETRLTDIINFLPDATFVIDLEGKIIIWNQAAEEYTGRKAEEMLGKGNHEYAIPFYGSRRPILADLVLHPSAEVEQLYPYVRRAGGAIIGESYTRSTKHGKAYMFGIAAPLYDSEGTITGAIESIHDITERKKAETALFESERKFHAIFDQTFQFIGLIALDGTVLEVNKTALRFSGLEESDVVGRPFWETQWWVHSPELQEKLRAAVKMAAEGEFVRFETNHPAVDGTTHFFDFSLKPVRDETGNVVLVIPEGRDITERKEMEQMKDEMMSAVSHEMRTPLTAMMGYTEFMLDNEVPTDQQKEYLRIILRETERLNELIGNFLDLQRLRSRGPTFTCLPLALQPLLEETAALFAGVSQHHHITLDCPPDLPQVCGNEKHLRQVFSNLISNAVKYSPKGGEVRLAVRREKDSVVVTVKDEGIGIPSQAIERIFERFYRVDNTARREFGGTGLGLSLVREIVAAHGGRIWVESTFGKGSTFFVSLSVA